jgi:hypothetical protein
MNTSKKRRILSIAPVAVAVALSVAACGAPCMAGSSGAPASNTSATSNGALSNTASSAGTGAGAGSASSGASGFGAAGGSAAGGSAAGGSAVGGQGGFSSGGSATAGTATPGQAGVSSGGAAGGFGPSDPAAGMTPDQVAAFCTGFPYDPTIEQGKGGVDSYTALRKVTPVQLLPYVDAMLADNQAIESQKRVYAQLKDEMDQNFKPLKDFHDQICIAH